MTASVKSQPNLATKLVNGILSIKPLANFAKTQARKMIIKRAEKIGVPWRKQAKELSERNWDREWEIVNNPNLSYPEYYLTSFHAYEKGNMSWEAAMEEEVAALAVHANIWPEEGIGGDARLRKSFLDILKAEISTPNDILDLGCGAGLNTFSLQKVFPQAKFTGVDLSPYFLAVGLYRSQQQNLDINWVHAAAEATGLPDDSFDLISISLVCHELPQTATRKIFREARRLLRQNGNIAIMDMNPKSEVYATMKPYVFTLLKSTEPYLDEYFTLDIEKELIDAGFMTPKIICNTHRHRTIISCPVEQL
ncbi:MAG: class I SAM-dependent methyltransferase [Okeania sp. SIO2G4]|uniref:class I SAM-dependent methyltransferase n=1 Tax=unclassified Okeania TaxID=2634635 RepID=UPI0013BE4227|nr:MULTISPECIES: class I SAM-dependent methyltransferase [unclassified Okeania]NEP05392.1 class I SAM-dependent methyltransferase [Okeania sp. SIO4D6]NEP39007.1 class I SAM-dependent methyltransferase [Okeania sp. SIO2H7]NEP72289.1 class I SAM-dependent methyltransferase [Okeania sp. SIO2G5]NEP93192.1 class I SAM-dependent methyltransferase [Okeania sp. SIO2F5]NEQ90568.1 class I SAM-dependent methyltransferase [Okeania sp. SIO2G4]